MKTTVLGRQNFFSSILHCDINVTDHYVISCQQGRRMIQTTKQHAVTLYLTVWSSSLYFYSLFFCLTAALPQLTGIQNVPLANGRCLFFLHKAKQFFFFPPQNLRWVRAYILCPGKRRGEKAVVINAALLGSLVALEPF